MNISWINSEDIEPRIDAKYYSIEYINNENILKSNESKLLKEIYIRGDYGSLPDSNDYDTKGIPLVRGTDLNNLSINTDSFILVPDKYYSEKASIEEGDILILIKGATIDSENSVAIADKELNGSIFNGSIFRVRLNNEYNPYFVACFMSTKYFLMQKSRAISNTGIYYNDKNSLDNSLIYLPSYSIQEFIGNKVKKAQELRMEAKKLEDELKDLFLDEFPFSEVNKSEILWNVDSTLIDSKRLDITFYKREYLNIVDKIKRYNGNKKFLKDFNIEFKTGASVSSEDFLQEGIPLVRIRDIGFDKINFKTDSYVSQNTIEKFSEYISQSDDIVVGMDGDDFRANIFTEQNPKVLINQRITIIKSKDINPYYLYYYINSYLGQKQLQRYCVKTTVGHIGIGDIKDIIICIPKEGVYNKISQKVRKRLLNLYKADNLLEEAKRDIEDLIEGNFDMSKLD